MRIVSVLIMAFGLSVSSLYAQDFSFTKKNIKNLDESWEKAQLELNYDYLNHLLAEDFIWVHNHAGTVDDKQAVLNRIKRHLDKKVNTTRSRNSNDVKVIILGNTAVVSGFTIVDRGPHPVTYSFMRTYAKKNEKCYLVANHTMAVPEKK